MIMTELRTNITADTSDFNRKMLEASATAGKFSGNVIGSLAKVGVAVTALGTGAFAYLTSTILDTAESLDSFIDKANMLSIDTGELQKLAYAAKLAGVSNEQLTSSLQKMVRTVGLAESGNKKAADSISALGIKLKDLAGLSADQQFLKIAEAIKSIPSPTEQARLAMEIFNRSGQTQLNLLRSDIQGASAEFEKLGGVISQSQADAVQQLGDTRDKFSDLWEAFKIQLTVNAVPAFQELYKWITDTVQNMGGIKEAAKAVADFIVAGMQLAVKAFQGFLDIIMSVVNGLKSVKLLALETQQSFNNFGFAVTGGDLDLNRIDEIVRLRKEISDSQKSSITAPLQKGLANARNSLSGPKQEVDVNVKVDPSDMFYVKIYDTSAKVTAKLFEDEARKVAR